MLANSSGVRDCAASRPSFFDRVFIILTAYWVLNLNLDATSVAQLYVLYFPKDGSIFLRTLFSIFSTQCPHIVKHGWVSMIESWWREVAETVLFVGVEECWIDDFLLWKFAHELVHDCTCTQFTALPFVCLRSSLMLSKKLSLIISNINGESAKWFRNLTYLFSTLQCQSGSEHSESGRKGNVQKSVLRTCKIIARISAQLANM